MVRFSPNRSSCVDHVYTLSKIAHGRKDAGLTTDYYCVFLDACTEGLRHGGENKTEIK